MSMTVLEVAEWLVKQQQLLKQQQRLLEAKQAQIEAQEKQIEQLKESRLQTEKPWLSGIVRPHLLKIFWKSQVTKVSVRKAKSGDQNIITLVRPETDLVLLTLLFLA